MTETTTATTERLQITTETLRLLTPDQLRLVSGGRHRPNQCTEQISGCPVEAA